MIDLITQKSPFRLLAERDMDLLVLEEMHASAPFRNWLVGKLYNGSRRVRRFLGAWHTPSNGALGSVDILFLFEEASGRKCAILIENKIDQPKQDLQAQRYFEFGEKGVEEKAWDEYLTCLFSPQAYFSKLEPSEYFSSYLSYEELEGWFAHANEAEHGIVAERGVYKRMLIRSAIRQGTGEIRAETAVPKRSMMTDYRVFPGGVFNLPKGYREAEDTILGKFWHDYQTFADSSFPHLKMKKPQGSASEAGWVEFCPDEFPRDIKIIHKMPQGFMDLSFAMSPLAMIQAPYQPYLDQDMAFKDSGKAAVIRICVPVADPQQPFENQHDAILFALQKADRLYRLYMTVVNGGSEASAGYAPEELFL